MRAQLIITMDDNGQIGVQAPLNDKFLCYGLLECARDLIAKYQPPKSPLVVAPPGSVVPKTRQ